MKVLFVNEHCDPVGGAEQVMLAECRALEAAGHEAAILHRVPAVSGDGRGLRTHVVSDLGDTRGSLAEALSVVAGECPDLVHMHGVESPPLLAALSQRVPTIRDVHSQSFWCPGNSKMLWRRGVACGLPFGPRCLANALRERCATVRPLGLAGRYRQCRSNLELVPQLATLIVHSEYMRQELLANGVPPAQLELLPLFPACEPRGLHSWPTAHSSASDRGKGREGRAAGNVLFVGRLVRAKGWRALLEAAAQSRHNWEVTIVGEGPEREFLGAEARRLGLAERVHMSGFCEGAALSAHFDAADLVALPSLWPEPLGMVGLEAMAHGKPVVAFQVGGVTEWLVDGETGVGVPRGDISGLARAIDFLLADGDLRARFGASGRERCRGLFSRERHCELLLALYRRVLDQRPAASAMGGGQCASAENLSEKCSPRRGNRCFRGEPRAASTPRIGSKVGVFINGSSKSAAGRRARELFGRLGPQWEIDLCFRRDSKLASLRAFCQRDRARRYDLRYVMDLGWSGVLAALGRHWLGRRRPLIVDTGDPIHALVRSMGLGGPARRVATLALEQVALRCATHLVVRGTYHARWLRQLGLGPVSVIHDGIDPTFSKPLEVAALRQSLGLDNCLVLGLLGSLAYAPRLGICYGWDVVEALSRLADLPVKALLVGDGQGLPWLKRRARELGVADRVRFVGRVPYELVPAYVSAMDIAVTTQTDDVVGWCRTTGKLTEYMACERYVLASDVGEAHRLLPRFGMAVPYRGAVDLAYPGRLAARVRALAEDPAELARGRELREVACRHFAYDRLAPRLEATLNACR